MRKNFRILLTTALLLFANAAIAQGATAHNVKGTITIATPIVKEDFSKFTDGSEEKPSATNIAASGTIAASYTSVAGWTGASVFQAGGAADSSRQHLTPRATMPSIMSSFALDRRPAPTISL